MKLIKQVKLFFKEGNSDKVYEIDLCEINPERYVVNFRYGKRGSKLKDGTKTPEFVSLEKAQTIFDMLEMEKRKKGYQAEIQTFVELPVLDSNEKDPVKKAVLKRLEDAVLGVNTFKTEWKTSRVIWKATELNLIEAVPFILKLATKDDHLQLYASLNAFRVFKVESSLDLLQSITMNKKFPLFLRNLALLITLEISNETVKSNTINYILSILPPEIKYFINQNNKNDIQRFYKNKIAENSKLEGLSIIYVLSEEFSWLKSIITELISEIPFKSPFFQEIRAIYKLSVFKADAKTQSQLAYLFEKNSNYYVRTASLNPESYYTSQYFPEYESHINLKKEYKKDDCRIAFSQFTKLYFQKHAVKHLLNLGKSNDAKAFLGFAVNALIQYENEDYSEKYEKFLSEYGEYNYTDRKYYFTKFEYPECSKLYLLSTILFGNDNKRILNSKLEFYTNKKVYESNQYYFNSNNAKLVTNNSTEKQSSEKPKITKPENQNNTGLFGLIKGIFSAKKVEIIQPKPIIEEKIPEPIKIVPKRLELFPELWDEVPQAYIQLILQAKMERIVNFADENFRNHPKFDELIKKLDIESILKALLSEFTTTQKIGFSALKVNENNFTNDAVFVAEVLKSKLPEALEWAQNQINKSNYFNNVDFVVSILFNKNKLVKKYIFDLLSNQNFSVELKNSCLIKTITMLLPLENSDENNSLSIIVSNRLNLFATSSFFDLSWEIVGDLLNSPLDQNVFLASTIILEKSSKGSIPIEIIEILIQNKHQNIRENGLKLLENLPNSDVLTYFTSIIRHLQSSYEEVIQAILKLHLKVKNSENTKEITERLLYRLTHPQTFEGSHELFKNHLLANCKEELKKVPSKMIVKLLFSYQKQAQNTGAEMLYARIDFSDFSLQQILALGNHDIYRVRQWVWNFFKSNINFIKENKTQALQLLDSRWEDTRLFGFNYFDSEFQENDWNVATIVGLVDSVRPDVENFGKNLIQKYFHASDAWEKIFKLSQHPTVNIQLFVTNYLEEHIKDDLNQIKALDYFYRSVLSRVNQARIAKNRVFNFLKSRALISKEHALYIGLLLDDISAISTIQDKAKCIEILSEIKMAYPEFESHLILLEHASTL